MKREEVRNFLFEGINESGIHQFNSGRVSEFNSEPNKLYPYVWIESLVASTTLTNNNLPIDTWSVRIHVAKIDRMDSSASEYEEIVDDCDLIAQKIIHKYNTVIEGYKLMLITGISRTPFIKKHSDCTTGVILSFSLAVPNKTNLC